MVGWFRPAQVQVSQMTEHLRLIQGYYHWIQYYHHCSRAYLLGVPRGAAKLFGTPNSKVKWDSTQFVPVPDGTTLADLDQQTTRPRDLCKIWSPVGIGFVQAQQNVFCPHECIRGTSPPWWMTNNIPRHSVRLLGALRNGTSGEWKHGVHCAHLLRLIAGRGPSDDSKQP